ncbi:hypothetical protein [Mangrovivirga cuniculi]|uniref:Uncharacterized protein n=1 Tax=Mangrovivirga cuniculi TaxID=2715131 RepID=A0A4D7JYM4_9BACT|nr:hypothetical protein [Mangrovivirga cuniculi]QCK13774.1 hypothetical protein DCC35_02875 [Mangrovivirga cuniculi]
MKLARRYLSTVSRFLLLVFILEGGSTLALQAQTSGPSQPEFTSFTPYSHSQMVDLYTGNFSYNLPLLEVPGPGSSGYPVSLSYSSDIAAGEEASWVGLGWTLNTGAINRSVNGLPDDYYIDNTGDNGSHGVVYHTKQPNNNTTNATLGTALEVASLKKLPGINLSAEASVGMRYNNYRGFGLTSRLGASLMSGFINLGIESDHNGQKKFNHSINPSAIAGAFQSRSKWLTKKMAKMAASRIFPMGGMPYMPSRTTMANLNKKRPFQSGGISNIDFGGLKYFNGTHPTTVTEYDAISTTVSLGLDVIPWLGPIGTNAYVSGTHTVQLFKDKTISKAYGFLYSSAADKDSEMDYSKGQIPSYHRNDEFISAPLNGADQFMVSAEGLSGVFKAIHPTIGHFKPREVENTTTALSVGLEVNGGAQSAGIGFKGVGGSHASIKYNGWVTNGAKNFSDQESVYFRFNNDPASIITNSSFNNSAESARISGNSANVNHINQPEYVKGDRSVYIEYNLNSDFTNTNRKAFRPSYDPSLTAGKVTRSSDKGIGSIAMHNVNGLKYVFGIPVEVRNEKFINYGTSYPRFIDDDFKVYSEDGKTKQGFERNGAYASTFLLTEITGPDFVDLELDGPTPDDLGSYTKFSYNKDYGDGVFNSDGSEKGWYKWRTPYDGLKYEKNSLSDPRDDQGIVRYGEKEVYYLNKIETKTHVAIFYTKERDNEGFGALTDEDNLAMVPARSSFDNPQKLRKLEKIELYLRNSENFVDPTISNPVLKPSAADPIKTIKFTYAEDIVGEPELMIGVPNAKSGRGRLTLKEVTFIYNGIESARLNSYKFDYQYPRINYPAPFGALSNYAQVSDGVFLDENPTYKESYVNNWGMYDPGSYIQKLYHYDWDNQFAHVPGNYPDDLNHLQYDPAAWTLKKITMPSGGEIHVQYEEDEYMYVQDKRALTMTPLLGSEGNSNFQIDLSGHNYTSEQLTRLEEILINEYVNPGKPMYFKFLYQLINSNNSSPSPDNCNSEYIEGYFKLHNVSLDGSILSINLTDSKKLPYEVCEEFVKTQRIGMINGEGDCNSSGNSLDGGDAEGIVKNLTNYLGKRFGVRDICKKLSYINSYVRLPNIKPKKGGGIRVKRLITYDNSANRETVLGTEYIYQKKNTLTGKYESSGVATNDPNGKENPLIQLVPRDENSWRQDLFYGSDLKTMETPWVPDAMPAPSVGYSSVITKNLYDSQYNSGFVVTNFYSPNDPEFSMKMEKSELEIGEKYTSLRTNLLSISFESVLQLAQGFVVSDYSNFYGRIKDVTTYEGAISSSTLDEISERRVISSVKNEYFNPEDKIPVASSEGEGLINEQNILMAQGYDVEYTYASQQVIEGMVGAEYDADGYVFFIGILGPIPLVTLISALTTTGGEFSTHATTKVISYPAVLKRLSALKMVFHISMKTLLLIVILANQY